jgi:hypothetical protein
MYISHFTPSEFQDGDHAPYLFTRSETNVLNSLVPNDGSRTEITRHLVQSMQAVTTQHDLTAFHVRWAMECIGYAFTLSVEHATVIRNAMNIYRAWLNLDNSENRPAVISHDEEFYQGEILMHMSLLFDRKPQTDGRHSEMCKSVLVIYRDLVRSKPLSQRNWGVLLKLLLLIVPKQHTKDADFHQLLYATFFEVWIHSNTRDQTLWRELESICVAAEPSEWLIYQWASLAKALTRRVVRIFYGNDKGLLELKFKTISTYERMTVPMLLPYEQVIYFWFKVLHLPLSKRPENPNIHSEVCQAIDKIADCFLLVCRFRSNKQFKNPDFERDYKLPELTELVRSSQEQHTDYILGRRRLPIPSANALLNLLGPWLFTNSSTQDNAYNYFDKGQSYSIRTLCKIICQAAGPVSDEHLRRFYGVILSAFNSKTDLVTTEIFLNSQTLFTQDHKGVRSLLTYEPVVRALCLNIIENKSATLQDACVNIVASVAALPLHYSEHTLLQKEYRVLGEQLETVFCKMIRVEKRLEVFKKIVWSAVVFSASANEIKPVEKVLEVMLAKLQALDMQPDREMYHELLEVISTLPFLLMPRCFDRSKELATRVLLALAGLVSNKLGSQAQEKKLMLLYFAILHWLSCFPQVAEDISTRRIIVAVMGGTPELRKHQLSQYALRRLQHILGRELPPIKVGPNLFIHLAPSSQMLRRADLLPKRVNADFSAETQRSLVTGSIDLLAGKYYMLGRDVLVSLFDTEGEHEEVLMVIRDMFGCYVWKAQLVYRSDQQPQVDTNLTISSNAGPKPLTRPSSSLPLDDELSAGLGESERLIHSQVMSFMRAQEQTETQFLKSPTVKKEFKGPLAFFSTERVPKAHRLFLAQLGFLTTKSLSKSKILALEHEPIAPQVHELDALNEREVYVLPLLYIPHVEAKPSEVMTYVNDYTDDFHEFLKTMGIPLKPENSLELFSHLLSATALYRAALYAAGCNYELLTVTPALMPELRDNAVVVTLSNFINRKDVVVVWNARLTDATSQKKPSLLSTREFEGKITITITPLQNKLFRVNVTKECGPLLDNAIVPMSLLAPLLTRTVINLNALRNSSALETVRERKKLLAQVYETGTKLQAQLPDFSALFSYAFAH